MEPGKRAGQNEPPRSQENHNHRRTPESKATFTYVQADPTQGLIEEAVCQICFMPMVDPRVLACCEHAYCRDCLELIPDQLCPTDRVPLGAIDQLAKLAERTVLRRLDALLVCCPHLMSGECPWQGPRGNLEEHIARTCEHTPCAHLADGCEWRGRAREMLEHVETTCDFTPVTCPNSGCTFCGPRHVVAVHANDGAQCEARLRLEAEQAEHARLRAEAEEREAAQRAELARRQRIERQLAQRTELMALLNPRADDLVRLTVSGRVFVVGRQTLCQDGESVLAQLLTAPNRQPHTTAGGEVVLDMDADAFAHIVLWLRTGVVPLAPRAEEAAVLMHYARLLSLRGLVAALGGEDVDERDEADADAAATAAHPRGRALQAGLHRRCQLPAPRITQARLLEYLQVGLRRAPLLCALAWSCIAVGVPDCGTNVGCR
jgi:hypothetical protein